MEPGYVIYYVRDMDATCDFYRQMLELEPAHVSPLFSMFVLPSGLKLGLWQVSDVEPGVTVAGGGMELAFMQTDRGALLASFERWRQQGVAIAQMPVQMDFGFTAVILDPDGQRIRFIAEEAG